MPKTDGPRRTDGASRAWWPSPLPTQGSPSGHHRCTHLFCVFPGSYAVTIKCVLENTTGSGKLHKVLGFRVQLLRS